LAFPADSLEYFNGVLPEVEPDNILFFCDVAFGGGDNLSMPICYVYGDIGYVVDVVFDKRAKDITQPRIVGKILQHRVKMGRFEGNNGGDFFCDDVSGMLKEKGYHCNLSHKKAPTTMSKLSRIEQYSPEIRKLCFLTDSKRDDDYRRFMNELTTFSFTTKNLHDDAADSVAGLCSYLATGVKSVSVVKRPF
jgi:predicted phage terminase large subunit-like protein